MKMVKEDLDLIKNDLENIMLDSFENIIKSLANEKNYEKRICEAILVKDTKQTIDLLKKVDQLIIGRNGLGLSEMYSNLEFSTMVQGFMDGKKDKVIFYLSDWGYGRLIITYDDKNEVVVKTGNQTPPGSRYLWDIIK